MSQPSQSPKSLPAQIFALLSSYGLAILVLSFLLIDTYLGTIAQTEFGLLDSQRKYFESWFLVHDLNIGGTLFPVPLPGGALLMVLLTINMLCGAVIRMRKGWRTIGVLISHVSIIVMLVAGFVSFVYKTEGAMPLFEGQTSDIYQSYHERVIEIRRFNNKGEGDKEALVIPMSHFSDLAPGRSRTFHSAKLPFELDVTGYVRNGQVSRANQGAAGEVDGYSIHESELAKEDEANTAALIVTARVKDQAPAKAILWELERSPFTVKAGDDTFAISLTRQKWQLPFSIRLDDFQRELHPGTQKAKRFTSHVTKITNGVEEPRVVTMNVPVRDQGFVVYQASFDPRTLEQSIFTVASNPSDQWPLYSCVAVGFGLLLHFCMHFVRFLARAFSTKRVVVTAPKPTPSLP